MRVCNIAAPNGRLVGASDGRACILFAPCLECSATARHWLAARNCTQSRLVGENLTGTRVRATHRRDQRSVPPWGIAVETTMRRLPRCLPPALLSRLPVNGVKHVTCRVSKLTGRQNVAALIRSIIQAVSLA